MILFSLCFKVNVECCLCVGYLWVYSNEVDVVVMLLNVFVVGDQVVLEMVNGKLLGIVVLSLNNFICGCFIFCDIKYVFDKLLLVYCINIVFSLCEWFFDKLFYWLVYGDFDLLFGLVVDCFGDVLVV